jgi:hypothetical protein
LIDLQHPGAEFLTAQKPEIPMFSLDGTRSQSTTTPSYFFAPIQSYFFCGFISIAGYTGIPQLDFEIRFLKSLD